MMKKPLIILLPLLFAISCSGAWYEKNVHADKGILDLRNWDSSKHPVINLRGQWEFYWSRLAAPGDFTGKDRPAMTGYLNLPGLWNGYPVGGRTLDGLGFATLRLKILVPPGERLYGLKLTEMESAYRLWVDGMLMTETGVVGTSKDVSKASWKRKEVYFGGNGPSVEIVLQMSNFHHRKGGPEEVVKFGRGEDIARYKSRRYGIELFLVGSIFIIGIYHLIIFLLRRKERSALWFALLCISVSIRTLLGGEKIFLDIFPGIGWRAAVTFEYLVLFMILPAFALFFYAMFREIISWLAVRITVGISLLFELVVLVTSPAFFSYLAVPYQAILLVFGLYTIVVTMAAVYRKKQGSLVYLAGVLVLFLTTLSDVLYNNLLVDTSRLVPGSSAAGLLVFILSQSVILAMYYSDAFTTIEVLSRDLEKKVDERTAELQSERNKLARIVIEDDLTGLYNRRYSLEYLKSEYYRFSRYGAVFSVLIIDLDHFKKVNDSYGHLKGDEVLREIGSVLRTTMRMSDICGRFGGEEYLVILPETKKEPAGALAEKIRSRVRGLVFESDKGPFSISCSIGVAQAITDDSDYNAVLQHADAALYAAKEQGRDRVVSHE